tara:strand:+ start:390 stop:1622 length:1233 start_codon:yes stop_codon:yes gene_type:complete
MTKYNKNKSFKYKGITIPLQDRKGTYSINKMIEGEHIRQSLGTSDFETAKQLAMKLIQARLNPDGVQDAPIKRKRREPTTATFQEVWDCLVNAESLDWSKDTKRAYYTNVRGIIHYSTGLDYDECFKQRLSIMTKKSFFVNAQDNILRGVTDKLERDSKKESMNSMLTGLRSWFGKKVMAKGILDDLVLPDLTVLRSIPKLPVFKKDTYTMPDHKLMKDIVSRLPELLETYPRAWVAFHTTMDTGLRKQEVKDRKFGDFIEGEDGNCFLRCGHTIDHINKGKKERLIPVSPTLKTKIQQVHLSNGWPCTDDDYILPIGKRGGKNTTNFNDDEQGERGFRRLAQFMKECGWTRKQKAHELRKIYASWACREHGVYAVKEAMGHSNLSTTERYAEKPRVGVTEVGLQYVQSA